MQVIEIHNWDVQFDINERPVYRKFSVSGAYLTIPLELGMQVAEPTKFQYVVVDGPYADFCGYSEF